MRSSCSVDIEFGSLLRSRKRNRAENREESNQAMPVTVMANVEALRLTFVHV
jgi:hypothetical protein